MKSIDMAVHLQGGAVLYQRVSARTEAYLRLVIKNKAEQWGREGVWSNWNSEGGGERFYPAHAIAFIEPYNSESFGEEEK